MREHFQPHPEDSSSEVETPKEIAHDALIATHPKRMAWLAITTAKKLANGENRWGIDEFMQQELASMSTGIPELEKPPATHPSLDLSDTEIITHVAKDAKAFATGDRHLSRELLHTYPELSKEFLTRIETGDDLQILEDQYITLYQELMTFLQQQDGFVYDVVKMAYPHIEEQISSLPSTKDAKEAPFTQEQWEAHIDTLQHILHTVSSINVRNT
jgi:hypothetical protein